MLFGLQHRGDVTFRSAFGDLIASGQTTGTLTCATGETCGDCFTYLPGFQCVEGTCPVM